MIFHRKFVSRHLTIFSDAIWRRTFYSIVVYVVLRADINPGNNTRSKYECIV